MFTADWNYTDTALNFENIPIVGEFDVIVAGGGASGIAAATTCGENNLNTLLIEHYGFCGGGAVAGLSGTICGLYYATNDSSKKPEQAVLGFADRFATELRNMGGLTAPAPYGKTFIPTHDPMKFRLLADNLLTNANVHISYHTDVIGVERIGRKITSLVINTKAGIGKVKAKRFIDASGDADLIYRAGGITTMGDNGVIQNPTMMFRINNVNVDKYLDYWGHDTISPQKVIDMLIQDVRLPRKKVWLFPTTQQGQILCNMTRLLGKDGRDLNVTNPIDRTEAEIVGREQAYLYAQFLKDNIPGCENSELIDTGVEIGIRQTRTINGIKKLTNTDVTEAKKHKDGIVKCPWPIELHSGEKPRVQWNIEDYYEIPYGTLVPQEFDNIIVAGRCLSSEHEALASARVVAQCLGYGEAASLATIHSIQENIQYADIEGTHIRYLLDM